ncbi:hypothetical protein [Jiangella sp. DSM 45060]|uniref:hypothetical protein n=1 Tax=Jiangella sp. DSM 45060 TaxID=1798224 RepID=UPI00087A7C79|nr:hypothetical protein [Jiangella sp. DSM 45060]SDS60498.1 hypothetical protein SAMN04515669_1472 [Jiangella sp. DSM 45060]
MGRPARPQPSDPEWDGDDRDLDAVGLAAHFAEYARRTRRPAGDDAGQGGDGDQRRAIGAWLDELIAELERDAGDARS